MTEPIGKDPESQPDFRGRAYTKYCYRKLAARERRRAICCIIVTVVGVALAALVGFCLIELLKSDRPLP